LYFAPWWSEVGAVFCGGPLTGAFFMASLQENEKKRMPVLKKDTPGWAVALACIYATLGRRREELPGWVIDLVYKQPDGEDSVVGD